MYLYVFVVTIWTFSKREKRWCNITVDPKMQTHQNEFDLLSFPYIKKIQNMTKTLQFDYFRLVIEELL